MIEDIQQHDIALIQNAMCRKEINMDSGVMWGWIGGIAGVVIGLTGGMIGTYFSVKNTNGPRERAFVVKAVLISWTAILVFLALILVLPDPYRWLMWIPYNILLPFGIIHGNRRLQAIRQQEAQNPRANTV